MARAGFFHARGPSTIESFGAKAGETIAKGDLVCIDASTGYVDIATAIDTSLLGVAVSDVSSATAGDEILVETNPMAVFVATCSGTSSQALVGDYLDIEGTTGAMYINENASTYGVVQLLEPVSAVGASAEHYCSISRHARGSRVPTSITVNEMAANSVDSDQYVDGSIDTAHFAAGAVDTAALNANALTATKIPDYAEGTEHIPFVVSKTLTATAGTYTICTATVKFRVIDWWIIKRDTTASNVKLNNGTNDMSADVASGTSDDAIVRGGDIIAEYDEIAAAGTLKAITDGNSAMEVFAMCVPIA